MIHRHMILYKVLGLIFLIITAVLAFISLVPTWPASIYVPLFTLSLFSLLLALSYFHLSTQEGRGFS